MVKTRNRLNYHFNLICCDSCLYVSSAARALQLQRALHTESSQMKDALPPISPLAPCPLLLAPIVTATAHVFLHSVMTPSRHRLPCFSMPDFGLIGQNG